MSKLEEIKEAYAKENEYSSWDKLELYSVHHEIVDAVDEISKRYAKAKLEEAAERAKISEYSEIGELVDEFHSGFNGENHLEINKQSITETPLD